MIFGTILSSLLGGGLRAIIDRLGAAYELKMKAQSEAQKLEADTMIEQLKAQQAVVLAEQGKWMTSWIRPALALPVVAYYWKVIIWDKVFGLGSTDALSADLTTFFTIVVGAYFVTRPLEKIFRG